jgi:hypothetical protein
VKSAPAWLTEQHSERTDHRLLAEHFEGMIAD